MIGEGALMREAEPTDGAKIEHERFRRELEDGIATFARRLILYAQQEEVFYPASSLVGEYVKLRLWRR